jgi:SSS family solute:Na+ symporter
MLDAFIIALYLAGILAVGVYAARRVRGLSDFFVAGRKVGTPACTATLCATIIGGSATIGMAGLGFRMGLTGAWWLLVGAIGLVTLAVTFGGRVRKSGAYTLPELMGKLYDGRTRLAASVLIIIAWLGVIAGQILAVGAILSTFLGWSVEASAVVSTLIFLAYTVLGGQRAVVRTDIIQFVMIIVGVFLLTAPIAIARAGGLSGLEAGLPSGHFAFPTGPQMGAVDVVSLFLLVGMTYVVGPDIYSRLFTAKNERTAKRSAAAAALFLVPLAISIVLIGMCARTLLPTISPDQSIPMVVKEVLPIWLGGIAIAAFLAALMSSADTLLMTTSTIAAWDIYKQHINPKASNKEVLRVSRWMIITIGLLALLIALWVEGVISALVLAYTVFSGGVIIPIIAGFYRKKIHVNSNGALAGIIGGGTAALLWKALDMRTPEPVVMGMVVCLLLLFGVSKLVPEVRRSRF